MARYGEAFRNRAVARLLPPESVRVGDLAKEIGAGNGEARLSCAKCPNLPRPSSNARR